MTCWADAVLVARLFAADPAGTGVALRAGAGPQRDRWLALVRDALPDGVAMRRVPLGVADERLLGGLDLAATLGAGRPVMSRGLVAEVGDGVLVLAMAERLTAGLAARLGAAADGGAGFGVVALDEGMDDEERPPAALIERLAFLVELEGDFGCVGGGGEEQAAGEAAALTPTLSRIGREREQKAVEISDAIVEALCGTAAALGIVSMRAPLQALRVARAVAVVAGRSEVTVEDAELAARLVLAPRATRVPEAEGPEEAQTPDGDQAAESGGDVGEANADTPLEDRVLEATRAAIPAGLLAQLQSQAARSRVQTSGKAGVEQRSGQRGRPAGVRAGDPRRGLRLNLIETLRAAAPWQGVRRAASGESRLQVRQADFRVTHLKQRSETTTIFAVDASGSAALNRLAEAKGAVELLLAECYVRRDRVAVLAFRGKTAAVLLPPTRSLVRAKRSLAGLPGGGGTPLAAGIDAGAALAAEVRRRGGTPTLVLLTDGRANVTRDGRGNRVRAGEDALAAARHLRSLGVRVLLVDTSPRPHAPNEQLALTMGARYLPLPYADAASLSRTVRANAA